MAIILNINDKLRIKKISKEYEIGAESDLFSNLERKDIVLKYILRDNYRDNSKTKINLAKKYSTDEKVIDKIIRGFHLKLLEDIPYLIEEFGHNFVNDMNREINDRYTLLGDFPFTGSYLNYIATEAGFNSFSQYKKYSDSEKTLESKVEESPITK